MTLTEAEFERAKVELEEAQRLRGWIANGYAQVEFVLGDLIVRCREFPEYAELTKTLPHGAPDRIKRVRRIISYEGPLSRFREALESILMRFETRHETRNLLAHGFCTYLATPSGDTGLHFQKWHRDPQRMDARLVRTFRMRDLIWEQQDISAVAQDCLKLFYLIHDHFGWVERPV